MQYWCHIHVHVYVNMRKSLKLIVKHFNHKINPLYSNKGGRWNAGMLAQPDGVT